MKHSISILVLFFAVFFVSADVSAQVKLQMDKFGKRKSLDFYEGQNLRVRMKQEKHFRSLEIKKIYPEMNAILTQHGLVSLENISRIRTYKHRDLNKYFTGTALSYTGTYLGYSGIAYAAYKTPMNWELLTGSLIGIGLTWAGTAMFNRRTYKINKRRKLRIIDFRF